MQDIIVEKPYEFIPPYRSTWWSTIIQRFDLFGMYLRRAEGIASHEVRHVERLQASINARHGVLLTPNHCRYADPLAMGYVARELGIHVYAMASWHLFNQSGFMAWAIRRLGGFSVNREGVDKQAIDTAISILESAERPLVIFPEGAVSRTNDKLHALLDGVAFIARIAAKKRMREDPAKKVVVHPIAIKYFFQGDIRKAAEPVLKEIETRLSWRPKERLPLVQRIAKIGHALLTLKEIEHFGAPQSGTLGNRLTGMIDGLLWPIEEEWLGARQHGGVVPRVKALRMKILPDMVGGRVSPDERSRRWDQLAAIYLSQQVSCYLPDYVRPPYSVDRILETIERFEEDLTDKVRVHGDLKAVIDIGPAIEVSPERDRKAPSDPLMGQIENGIQGMLNELVKESKVWQE